MSGELLQQDRNHQDNHKIPMQKYKGWYWRALQFVLGFAIIFFVIAVITVIVFHILLDCFLSAPKIIAREVAGNLLVGLVDIIVPNISKQS